MAVAVQADRLVTSRLQGSERAVLYLSFLTLGWGTRWNRQKGQIGLESWQWEQRQASQEHPASVTPSTASLASQGPSPTTGPGGVTVPGLRMGRITLGFPERPSDGVRMELLPQEPWAGQKPREEAGDVFYFRVPWGAQGQIETGSLQGRC